MLIKQAVLEAIVRGEVTLAFRRWRRPTVRTGGTLRTSKGVLSILAVETVDPGAISPDDAQRAGFADAEALRVSLGPGEGSVYRVSLAWQGEDPRRALREDADLDPDALTELRRRLARLDVAAPGGPWTTKILTLIAHRPGVRAPVLADSIWRDTPSFKRDVRKLKELGLTESLDVGYRLSPRGQELMRRLAGGAEPVEDEEMFDDE